MFMGDNLRADPFWYSPSTTVIWPTSLTFVCVFNYLIVIIIIIIIFTVGYLFLSLACFRCDYI